MRHFTSTTLRFTWHTVDEQQAVYRLLLSTKGFIMMKMRGSDPLDPLIHIAHKPISALMTRIYTRGERCHMVPWLNTETVCLPIQISARYLLPVKLSDQYRDSSLPLAFFPPRRLGFFILSILRRYSITLAIHEAD